MRVKIGDKTVEISESKRIMDIIDNQDYHYVAAKINNKVKELTYKIKGDSEMELLDLTDFRATKMYEAALRFLVSMACKRRFPNARIHFNYSVSKSIFCSISNFGHAFLQENLDELEDEINKLISLDLPMTRSKFTLDEAKAIYTKQGFYDKLKVLEYHKDELVNIYECDGYYDYMYDIMVPSTGYIKKFRLQFYSPGFLLFYPRSECKGDLPVFEDDKAFRNVLREANIWSNTIKVNSIAQINDKVINGKALELINISETRHNNQLAEIGLRISEDIERIKFIGVAGPSSSGKTTFTNRVRIELLARGIDPVMISMDDFYHTEAEKYPVDENGKPDYEHINALDLRLFDTVIYKLINGEAVCLPRYDFKTRKRTFTDPVKLAPKQPVLVEGIHALNDTICPSVPSDQKFKIFIAPLAQYGIDDHTPISLSEMRLIRRIVRDKQFRNIGCEKTLEIWDSVRAGEFKWIYKYQNNADIIFNSDLAYEPLVLAKYAIPVLNEIPKTSPYFVISTRLRRFLKYYESISDTWIPCNSLLREFVGGSIFYTDDKK